MRFWKKRCGCASRASSPFGRFASLILAGADAIRVRDRRELAARPAPRRAVSPSGVRPRLLLKSCAGARAERAAERTSTSGYLRSWLAPVKVLQRRLTVDTSTPSVFLTRFTTMAGPHPELVEGGDIQQRASAPE
jgi:hypothetical protein